jgi:3',5'-nucleoside bisphosphate phosphatase
MRPFAGHHEQRNLFRKPAQGDLHESTRKELMNTVDLHTHTTASDGLLKPEALIAAAANLALEIIAITDHDTIAGLGEGLAAAPRYGIEVIPGVEINTDVPGGEVHILGYYIDTEDVAFHAELKRLREGREGRGQQMVEKLRALGAPITWERVQAIAGDAPVVRPHVAQALAETGFVASPQEAFDKYIGRDGPAYAERLKMTPAEATAIIARARGIPVLAHPMPMGAAATQGSPALNLETMLPELMAAGLLGIEAYYTGYPMTATEKLLGLARRFGLIVTGGSDYHGPGRLMEARLGGVYVPVKVVRQLKALAHKVA